MIGIGVERIGQQALLGEVGQAVAVGIALELGDRHLEVDPGRRRLGMRVRRRRRGLRHLDLDLQPVAGEQRQLRGDAHHVRLALEETGVEGPRPGHPAVGGQDHPVGRPDIVDRAADSDGAIALPLDADERFEIVRRIRESGRQLQVPHRPAPAKIHLLVAERRHASGQRVLGERVEQGRPQQPRHGRRGNVRAERRAGFLRAQRGPLFQLAGERRDLVAQGGELRVRRRFSQAIPPAAPAPSTC